MESGRGFPATMPRVLFSLRQPVVKGVHLEQVENGKKAIESKSDVIDRVKSGTRGFHVGLGVVHHRPVGHLVHAIRCPGRQTSPQRGMWEYPVVIEGSLVRLVRDRTQPVIQSLDHSCEDK